MAKDKWDKLKILSDILKNNWPMIIIASTAITGWIGTGWQTMSVSQANEDLLATQQQVAEVANHYTRPVEKKVVNKVTKVYKTDCGICKTLLTNHEKEYH